MSMASQYSGNDGSGEGVSSRKNSFARCAGPLRVRVVKDFDTEIAQVHLDAQSQHGQWVVFEVVVVLESDLNRALVNLDEVGSRRVVVAVRLGLASLDRGLRKRVRSRLHSQQRTTDHAPKFALPPSRRKS